MDPSVSLKDEIWFLRVCHHISNAVYNGQAVAVKDHHTGVQKDRQLLDTDVAAGHLKIMKVGLNTYSDKLCKSRLNPSLYKETASTSIPAFPVRLLQDVLQLKQKSLHRTWRWDKVKV
jgi:hypothetical protein